MTVLPMSGRHLLPSLTLPVATGPTALGTLAVRCVPRPQIPTLQRLNASLLTSVRYTEKPTGCPRCTSWRSWRIAKNRRGVIGMGIRFGHAIWRDFSGHTKSAHGTSAGQPAWSRATTERTWHPSGNDISGPHPIHPLHRYKSQILYLKTV